MPLKELLTQNGIKQKWLAENIGVSEVTISSWCNGKSRPHKKHVEKLSVLLRFPKNKLTSIL